LRSPVTWIADIVEPATLTPGPMSWGRRAGGRVRCRPRRTLRPRAVAGRAGHPCSPRERTAAAPHARLLAEPERDASGYRRYAAQDAIDLIKIRTLAEAGVPLARIRELKAAPDEAFQRALAEIDHDLTARIRSLRHTQGRLRDLASGHTRLLPAEVDHHLQQLGELGFSERWVALEGDLWILAFATHPEIAHELFQDQAQALTDPILRQIYLDYDRAQDLDPRDPFLSSPGARQISSWSLRRPS
jgi:DNA-binding transcriptional MerR regulator